MGISFGDGRWFDNEYEQVADSHQQQPLRLTITPHMNEGESETGSSQGGLEEPKDIHIIRHGTTEENEEDKIRGTQDDVKLSDEGRKHALDAAEELRSKGIESLVTSPLARAKETSQIIGKELGIPITVSDKLKTWNVGNFEGKPCEGNNDTLQDYAENKPDEKVPGGESYNEFKDRAFEGIREAILANKDKKLGIVTHHMVESSLEGWEKTGQDNPSLDLSKLFEDTDQPGSVRKMTMEPDSTIMKGKDNLPFQKEVQPYLKKFRDALTDYVMNASGNLKENLLDILKHPENMIGPQEGMFIAPSLGKRLFAQGLMKQGLSPAEVKALTGVERGADSKLRQEISDLPSQVVNEKLLKDHVLPLEWVFHHPDFFNVYPEAKDIKVLYNPKLPNTTDARFTGDIELNPALKDPMDIHDAILHELQHWVQYKEGFAFNVPSDAPEAFVKEFGARMRKEGVKGETPKQRIYRQLTSEVEARNTQARAGMTEEMRRESLATSTEDIQRSHQLIFDEKGNRIDASPSMSKEPPKRFGLPVEVFEQRLRDVIEKNPDLRQVPWGWTLEEVKSIPLDDYFKGLKEGFGDTYADYLKNKKTRNPSMSRFGSQEDTPDWFKEEMRQTLEKELGGSKNTPIKTRSNTSGMSERQKELKKINQKSRSRLQSK